MNNSELAAEVLKREREDIATELAGGLADNDAGKCAALAMRALHALDAAICMLVVDGAIEASREDMACA